MFRQIIAHQQTLGFPTERVLSVRYYGLMQDQLTRGAVAPCDAVRMSVTFCQQKQMYYGSV
jgi:hypothetical protein